MTRQQAVRVGVIVSLCLLVIGERAWATWYLAQAIRVAIVALVAWESRAIWLRPRHLANVAAVVVAGYGCLVASCGGTSPMAPTPAPSFLAGTWEGSMTLTRTGLPDTVAATTWTFELVPLTGSTTYTVTVRVDDPWLAINTTLSASLTPPSPGGQLVTSGLYRSPRRCDGYVTSDGRAQPTRIEATFNGIDCDQLPETAVFNGRVVLTKR